MPIIANEAVVSSTERVAAPACVGKHVCGTRSDVTRKLFIVHERKVDAVDSVVFLCAVRATLLLEHATQRLPSKQRASTSRLTTHVNLNATVRINCRRRVADHRATVEQLAVGERIALAIAQRA